MTGGQVNAGFIENVHGAIQAQVAYMMTMAKPEVLDLPGETRQASELVEGAFEGRTLMQKKSTRLGN